MDEIKGRTTGIDRTRSTRNDTTRWRQTLRLARINEFSFDAAINNGVYIVYTILVLADEKTEGGRRRGLAKSAEAAGYWLGWPIRGDTE